LQIVVIFPRLTLLLCLGSQIRQNCLGFMCSLLYGEVLLQEDLFWASHTTDQPDSAIKNKDILCILNIYPLFVQVWNSPYKQFRCTRMFWLYRSVSGHLDFMLTVHKCMSCQFILYNPLWQYPFFCFVISTVWYWLMTSL